MSGHRLLVACRGEVAVRVVRAARELGYTSIVAHSDADAGSAAVALADESVRLGKAHARHSYLNTEAVLAAAAATGADGVHPGYGFLAENAAFAREVTDAGLVWVGPDAGTIARMGDKATAIAVARAAGVPVVPGSGGPVDAAGAARAAADVGFPLLVKASAGGGGRGIRVVRDPADLADQVTAARIEAGAAFGDDTVYLERFVERARHLEVQVMGDGRDVVHLFERDCSVQRRRQKIWEEAPAAVLDPVTRDALCDAAVRLARAERYRGAGTVEFLLDAATGEFFFIEMNTRIQVEHPVTEAICGVDLVRTMTEIAYGATLPWRQDDVVRRGHAIEVRVNAEDPERDFAPAPGRIEQVRWPGGPGVRVDTMAFDGAVVPPFYDSLIGKLVVHDVDRDAALARLRRALGETRVAGIATTLGLLDELAHDPDVVRNDVHTTWLEQRQEAPVR